MIQVKHFKWIHINRFLASKDASKWKAHGKTKKDTYGKKVDRKKPNKMARAKWGRGNERQMANNVVQGIRVSDGYLVCLELCIDLPGNGARNG